MPSEVSPPRSPRRLITGWGRTAPTAATVARPRNAAQVAELLGSVSTRGAIPRGLGRAYGDAAQSAGGLVLDCTELTTEFAIDPDTGRVRASAGLSLERLLRDLVPSGWFPSVVPGTRHVTLGGAVAADVHGKNHQLRGSFGHHIQELNLVLATGEQRCLGPAVGPELFWATIGGMGLTGIVTDVVFDCQPIESAYLWVDTSRTPDLDATLARLAEADPSRYSVAWLDLLADGASTGRGVVTTADHATAAQLPDRLRRDPLRYRPRAGVPAPAWAPSGLLNRASVRAFNDVWYRRAARAGHDLRSIESFFHPLDAIAGWNRLYGADGFVQYQFVVPAGAESTLGWIVNRLGAARAPSPLTVLKRFGSANPGHLSFPLAGWSLAFDLPAGLPGLAALLRDLDERVASVGGRVYLAKDATLSADQLPAMYPRLAQWGAVRDRVDPNRALRSDLARRLEL